MLENKDYCDYETSVALYELGYDCQVIHLIAEKITLYEAQKWLREEKKLFAEITIEAFDQTYIWEIYSTENSILIAFGDSSHNTYEEAFPKVSKRLLIFWRKCKMEEKNYLEFISLVRRMRDVQKVEETLSPNENKDVISIILREARKREAEVDEYLEKI